MNTLHISLPDEMTNWVENEVRQGGFDNASEFFRQLVNEAKMRREAETHTASSQAELEALLIEGLESGEGELVTAEWWAKLHSDMNDELKARDTATVDWESST